jgi:GPH family glycoside/pentoside/hexuronide:cation symporter
VAVVLLTVAGWYVDRGRLYTVAGVALGALSILPPLLSFVASRGVDASGGETTLQVLHAVRATLANRPFRAVAAVFLLSWTSASMLATTLVYFAGYHLAEPGQANYLVLVAQGSALACMALVVRIARRWDKRRAFLLGAGTWIAALAGIFLLPPHAMLPAYVLAAACGLGIATAYVIPWAMIPDVVDHDQLATGERREGSYYAFISFFQKLGTGVAVWAMGQVLSASGYVTPVEGAAGAGVALPAQPASAVAAIRAFTGPVPAALLALSIVACLGYPISREVHARMRERLAAKAPAG